jgi:chromate reductase, NAD(P)H dehydrogenase (quinone)
MRVLAVSGSLRRDSHNTRLLRAAAQHLPPGVELELYDGLKQIPPFDEDDEATPTREVKEWRAAINAADAVLFATPEYNGTLPGQLKHAVDWASRPYGPPSSLWGKPVAVIGASVTDYGALWAQDHLRKALGISGARVLEVELPVSKALERFDEDGVLVDLELRDRLAEIVGELAELSLQLVRAA